MEQLRCVLYFEPTPALERVGSGGSLFWPSTHVDGWVTEVEQLEGFKVALDAKPIESEVEQEHV